MRSLIVVAALAAAACSSTDKSPPYIGGDCETLCSGTPGGGAMNPGQVDGGGGATGTPEGGSGTLTGTVSLLSDISFLAATPFSGTGSLVVTGPTLAVAGDFSGSTFTVPNVESAAALWVFAEPATGSTAMPTFQPVDGKAARVDVALVAADVMTRIASMATRKPQTILPGRAQIVTRFVDANGLGVAGVTLTQTPGDDVLYDISTTGYSDTDINGFTGPAGVAIVLNAKAKTTQTALTLTYAGLNQAAGSFYVYGQADAVTLVTVRAQ
jgi:hypothetical protein